MICIPPPQVEYGKIPDAAWSRPELRKERAWGAAENDILRERLFSVNKYQSNVEPAVKSSPASDEMLKIVNVVINAIETDYNTK